MNEERTEVIILPSRLMPHSFDSHPLDNFFTKEEPLLRRVSTTSPPHSSHI